MKKLMFSLEKVLVFNSKLIVLSLENKKPEGSEVDMVRKHCDTLSNAGIYPFVTDCDDTTLFMQIEHFASMHDMPPMPTTEPLD